MRRKGLGIDLVDIEAHLVSSTDKAWKVSLGEVDDHDLLVVYWLPKSLVEWDPDSKTFTMPEWLAKKKGLI